MKIIDEIPEYLTVNGAIAYRELISLLYDIGKLINIDVNNVVDVLDYIVAHENY